MAKVETIVVGGGINPGTPFTATGFTFVSQADPPFLETSPEMGQVEGANSGIVIAAGRVDPLASTNVLRVKGGIVSEHLTFPNTVVLGQVHTVTGLFAQGFVFVGRNITLSSAAGSNNVEPTLIGNDVSVSATGSNANAIVAIGSNMSVTCTTIGNMVAIGTGIVITGAGPASVIIGASATSTTSGGGVVIGNAAQNTGTSSTSCVVIGDAASSSASSCTVVGNGANATASSSVVIGASATSTGISSVVVGTGSNVTHANNTAIGPNITSFATRCGFFGQGSPNELTVIVLGGVRDTTNAAGTSLQLRLRDCVTGTDLAGGSVTIRTGLGTGAGAVSNFNVQTPTVLASGTTVQTGTTRMTVDSGLGVALSTGLMIWDVDNGALERVSVGVADSGGVGFKLLRIPN